jgi:release factor glutamine methyltransferase
MELSAYRELVRARAARTPVAYLVGTVGFWKLTLAIRPGVLIPRPDTEALVEATLRTIAALRERRGDQFSGPHGAPLTVLELGTGSGAIPLAVCFDAQHLRWVAVDAAREAAAVAAENRRRHAHLLAPRGNALLLVRGDRFSALAPAFRPDLIVSNPPYIPSTDIPGLMPEVAQAEPRAALDGGVDGMVFHRYLLDHAAAHLTPGGRLLMEMGQEQGEALTVATGRRAGLRVLGLHKDLAGRDRVIEVERTAPHPHPPAPLLSP